MYRWIKGWPHDLWNIEMDMDQSLGCIQNETNACCPQRIKYIDECDTFDCMNPRAPVSIIHMISSTSCNGKGGSGHVRTTACSTRSKIRFSRKPSTTGLCIRLHEILVALHATAIWLCCALGLVEQNENKMSLMSRPTETNVITDTRRTRFKYQKETRQWLSWEPERIILGMLGIDVVGLMRRHIQPTMYIRWQHIKCCGSVRIGRVVATTRFT